MAPLRDLPLEDGRRGLLRWIGQARPQGSVNNQVTVVFDGHPDHFGSTAMAGQAGPQGEIKVIFSDGCSADDKIKRMVEEMPARQNCVVVTDDKDIFLYARSLGARVMSVPAFTGRDTKSFVSAKARQESGGKNISLSRQEKINQELRSFWLKEK